MCLIISAMNRRSPFGVKTRAKLLAGLLLLSLGIVQPGIGHAQGGVSQASAATANRVTNGQQFAPPISLRPTRKSNSDRPAFPAGEGQSVQQPGVPSPCGTCCTNSPERASLVSQERGRSVTVTSPGKHNPHIVGHGAPSLKHMRMPAGKIPVVWPRSETSRAFLITARLRI